MVTRTFDKQLGPDGVARTMPAECLFFEFDLVTEADEARAAVEAFRLRHPEPEVVLVQRSDHFSFSARKVAVRAIAFPDRMDLSWYEGKARIKTEDSSAIPAAEVSP